jgi:opacity protein-like surface antigen
MRAKAVRVRHGGRRLSEKMPDERLPTGIANSISPYKGLTILSYLLAITLGWAIRYLIEGQKLRWSIAPTKATSVMTRNICIYVQEMRYTSGVCNQDTPFEEKHMRKLTVLVFILIACAAAPAAAQETQSTASIGPQIGFYKAKDADAARGIGGVALRIKLNDAIGIEGSINYRKEDYDNGYVSVRTYPVMLTGLIYVVPVVYGAIGAGWYNTSIDYNIPSSVIGNTITISSETKQQFGWHFGGGVELPVGRAAKLVGDIRYVYLDYNFKDFPGSNGMSSNFYVMTVGLLFNL